MISDEVYSGGNLVVQCRAMKSHFSYLVSASTFSSSSRCFAAAAARVLG